ncbi:2-haloacid dehalogenase [Bradyrhizobium erythrophlei]|jgi:2-haloacid dehalogenase|nr:2-haloacid dehalogenase [Bradyrhizobium erythrophlei]
MTHDDQSSLERRKFLAGLGTATAGAIAANVVGGTTPAAAEAPVGAVVPSVCVFDVNGSLLATDALAPLFQRLFGNGLVEREWYEELALYSNVITSSGNYPGTFFELAKAVLQMVGSIHHVEIRPTDVEELGTRLLSLPAYPDVPDGLRMLKEAGFRLVTLTNSPPGSKGSETQLARAGIAEFFERHFNTHSVRRFKVAQSVYHMVAEEMDVPPTACCMITAHAWDALGAQYVGFSSGLMNRPGQASLVMHGLPQPLAVAPDLPGVAAQLIKLRRRQS